LIEGFVKQLLKKPPINIVTNPLGKKNLTIPLLPTIFCFPKFRHMHLFQFYKKTNKQTLTHVHSVNVINKPRTSTCLAMYWPNSNHFVTKVNLHTIVNRLLDSQSQMQTTTLNMAPPVEISQNQTTPFTITCNL
jgi:hypothetical protein